MEKCKYCQEELAEDSTLCPHCGKDNAEEAVEAEVAENVTEEPVEESTEETTEETTEEPKEEPAEEPKEEPVEDPTDETPEGEASEEAQQESISPAKLAIGVVALVLLAAALIAVVAMSWSNKKASIASNQATTEPAVVATVPADGNPDDATCKGTYTVTDEEAKAAADTIVATMGDKSLTNGQLQVYYWNMVNSYLNSDYGYALMVYGLLDYTQPLDTQISLEDESLTWQQFFLAKALDYWQLHQSLANEALAEGMEMEPEEREYLDGLEQSLTETAENYGMESLDELLRTNLGPGAGLEDFAYFQELYYTGKPYYTQRTEAMVPTQEELEAYFAEHEVEYAESGITKDSMLVDARHILLTVEGGTTGEDGTTTYSDEEWASCKASAQAVLDRWLAGDQTEDSFAELANEVSQDPGSNTNGGLYEDIYEGQMVEPFEQWCFDETRAYGDYGLVQTSYGYHVMFFVGSSPMWESYAESGWTSEQANLFIEELSAANPISVDYGAIKLGYIELG